MPDMFLMLRGGYETTGTDLVTLRFAWTHRSEAAAKQALADGVHHILAALYPTETDAPPCPTCSNHMSWSKERKKWRCHRSHRIAVLVH